MTLIPRELILECCRALAKRHKNAGSWGEGGCPECIQKVIKIFNIRDITGAFAVVELAIMTEAILLVANEISS